MSAHVVVDLGFGDSGKGTITDWLVREARATLVVRWNGGAQAGHTVVTDDGRAHTFSQFGAGTFVPGVRTHLAEAMVLHPTALLVEARHLARAGVGDALERTTIAERARVITPFHQAANRLRERARGAARHGTCGVGFGETVRDALEAPDDVVRARDLRDRDRLRAAARRARDRIRASLADELRAVDDPDERAVLDDDGVIDRWADAAHAVAPLVVADDLIDRALRAAPVVLEGAQGVLLDERHGFHPHTTWSDCTSHAALRWLRDHGVGGARRIGVLRTYLTRHGEGPFPTDDPSLDLPEAHNVDHGWQGRFRTGAADLVLARHALRASDVDELAFTHLDRRTHGVAVAYADAPDPTLFVHDAAGRAIDLVGGDLAHVERLGRALRAVRPVIERDAPVAETLAAALGRPWTIASHGPAPRHKSVR